MLTHYLKVAFRNLWKHKVQSLTGIFGLAFAVACFVPALYWIRYETSYDNFYPESENIYRVYTVEKQSGHLNKGISKILERKLRDHFPSIEASTVLISGLENCRTRDIPFVRLNFLYADSSFFSVFPQTIVSGETVNPLRVKNDIVLTESLAIRLFGDVNKAIGQQVQNTIRADWPPYNVTAVVKDSSRNSNLSFDAIIYHDMLISFSELPENMQWTFFPMDGYIKFSPQANIADIEKQLVGFIADLGVNDNLEARMIPIAKVRHELNSDVPFTLDFISLFIFSGILLLFAAIFNLMNFHVTLFSQRHRELHLRMVNGASGKCLILQMLIEQTCTILPAFFLAVCLIVLTRPVFQNLLLIPMDYPRLMVLYLLSSVAVLVIMWLVGWIVFFRLSRFSMHPISVQDLSGRPWLRYGTVTLQLAVSILFVVSSFVVMEQMRFVHHKDLGLDGNDVIQLSGFTDYSGKVQRSLMQELENIPQVENVTDTRFQPLHNTSSFLMLTDVEWDGKEIGNKTAFQCLQTDDQFAETFRLKMLAGGYWRKGQLDKVVLNEEAVRAMGLENPIGTIIRLPSENDVSVMVKYEVTGVVKNFHAMSLRNPIGPMILCPSSYANNMLYVRITLGQELEAVQRITAILSRLDPTLSDVRLSSVGDLYSNLNKTEEVGLKIFSILSAICLLLSLFGVYAMSVASTHRRRKEMAIRKVMGANIEDIIRLFFREYIRQVIIAGIIALPLAYWVMEHWLQGYAYRIDISGWLLFAVIAGITFIVLLTVFGQILKAANGNPAEVVKSE